MTAITRRLKTIMGLSLLAVLTLPLFYAFYHQLYQKGLQAEARLMLSYLHTLQRVYRKEEGGYAAFDWYGAPLAGADHCMQPIGAAQLGFLIHGCHEAEALPPRYAFRTIVASGGKEAPYSLEALSGSDERGRSLVCFQELDHERWESRENQAIEPVKSCW